MQDEEDFISMDDHSVANFDHSLFTVIATELHSPLADIYSNIQLIRKLCKYKDISLLNETFSFCEDSIDSILGFIENINFLFTSDICHVKPMRERYSLQLLIKQVFAELRHQNHDITRIRFSQSVDDFSIFPDRYLLVRILVNLLNNALKFSNRDVELLVSATGNELSVVVRDSGIGIPWKQVPVIFNPFVRGTNVKQIKGSGLGLPVVANAVKWLNGNITLHSEVSKGTEFRILFPCQDDVTAINPSFQKNKLPDHFEFGESEYSRIIGTISHELRTPMAILKSNIQLLKILTIEIDEDLKDKYIGKCEAALGDMERFFDRIPLLNIPIKSGLNVHRPDSGFSQLHVN